MTNHIPKPPSDQEEWDFVNRLVIDPELGTITKWGNQDRAPEHTSGYITIKLIKKNGTSRHFRRSHLVWWKHHSKWPEMMLDHGDLNKHNDRIGNLSEVTGLQNMANIPQTHSKGLPSGVGFNKLANKFVAYAFKDYKKVHLGYFGSAAEAIQARQDYMALQLVKG